MGDQEDPAGVQLGRGIPFLRDKLQKKTADATLGRKKPGLRNTLGTGERKCRWNGGME